MKTGRVMKEKKCSVLEVKVNDPEFAQVCQSVSNLKFTVVSKRVGMTLNSLLWVKEK